MPPWFVAVSVSPGELESTVRDECPAACYLVLDPGVYAEAVSVTAGQDVTLEAYGAELDGVLTVEPGGTLTLRDALLHGTVIVLGTVTLEDPITKGGPHPTPLIEVYDAGALLTVTGGELAGFTTDSSVVVVQEGDVTFDGTVFQDNFASGNSEGGAALTVNGGVVRLDDATVLDNVALTQPGGAIRQTGGRLELSRTSLTANLAANGGAIAMFGGELVVEGGTFVQNEATGDGGAIELTGGASAEVTSDFVDNVAGTLGGAISATGGTLQITASRSIRNSAAAGGSVYFLGDLVVRDTTFEGDSATGTGGSIFTSGSPDITGSRFTGSTAPTGAAVHVLNAGAGARIAQSAFCDVSAPAGSALHVDTSTALLVEHAVFGGGDGGAITADGSVVEVDHVTVIDHDLVGVAVDGGDLSVTDSLVGPLVGSSAAFGVDGTSAANLANVHFDPAPAQLGAVTGAAVVGPVLWLDGVVPTGEPWDLPCPNGPEFRIHPESAQYLAGAGGVDVGALGIANAPWSLDRDGDQVPWTYDCDDDDATVHGFAVEWCNGIDDDCDGSQDEPAVGVWVDEDHDGFGVELTTCVPPTAVVVQPTVPDCNDADVAQFPGAPDPPGDGIDQDCDGVDGPEAPGDSGSAPTSDTGAPTGPTGPTDPGDGTTPGGESGRSSSRAGGGRCDCDAAGPGPAGALALAFGAALLLRRQRSQQ